MTRATEMTVFVGLATAFVGCGSPPPPAPEAPPAPEPELAIEEAGPPSAEPIETGKDCVTAEALCEGGVCDATMVNDCDAAVTCAMEIYALCEGTTEAGEARGKSRETIPAGQKFVMQAGADCQGKGIMATQVDTLVCK